MKLTEDQIATVKSWIESGEDLGTIQKKIHENFDLNLTFLETRFLLSDLKLEFAEEEEEEEEEDKDEDLFESNKTIGTHPPAPPDR